MSKTCKGITVWVVRDSACGNGNDDSGVVLGVFDDEGAAERFANSLPPTPTGQYCNHYSIEVEGPFNVQHLPAQEQDVVA